MFCSKCGAQIPDNSKWCSSCGQPIQVDPPTVAQKSTNADEPNILLNILSLIIPLIGILVYFLKKNETPRKAKACGLWALAGFICNLILMASA